MASYERLLEETLSEDLETNDAEVPFDESDIDESDHEEVTEHSSDSEQDIDNADENNDNCQMTGPSFIAKDNTYWKKRKPPRTAITTRQENIMKRLPGPTQTTRFLKRPLEKWNNFFTEEILSEIIMCTNLFIEKIKTKYTRERDANKTDVTEIRVLLGLI